MNEFLWNNDRSQIRNQKPVTDGPVLYWMERDQRIEDNWALYYAQQQAIVRSAPLVLVFSLTFGYSEMGRRQYGFMLAGLQEVAAACAAQNISFIFCVGDPIDTIPACVLRYGVGEVVADFNPLRFAARWREDVARAIPVQFTEVDAHNVVPCWVASDKAEFAAHTFRPKLKQKIRTYNQDIPPVVTHPYSLGRSIESVDLKQYTLPSKFDSTVAPISWLVPGAAAARKQLEQFLAERLDSYNGQRNDPNQQAQSNLSPYLHFGQLSAQRVMRELAVTTAPRDSIEAFWEELIVRRELTDNFCHYTQLYDQVAGAHEWAQKTLAEHRDDPRTYVYTKQQFEHAQTHDPLWNAAQLQLVKEGKMHGYMRMYWAKKVLEWTNTPEYAIKVALYLNDKYSLDGTDPNGVVGVMWSICGVHDRAWSERPVFGKIRYMNYNGCKRKFDVAAYIKKYDVQTDQLFSYDQS